MGMQKGLHAGTKETVGELAGMEEVAREERMVKGEAAGVEVVGEEQSGGLVEGAPGALLGVLAAALA